jgi:hypothetical protein
MKIGVLYICTGKYVLYWKQFYESMESLFLPGHEKDYFVFTDAPSIEYEQKNNVHRLFQQKQEWPYPTLLRFQMFLKVEKELEKMDYIFFLNANMKVIDTIKENDVLPDPIKDDGLVVVLHSGFYKAHTRRLPYERKQKKSLAYMTEGKYYVQGSFNGGTTAAYLALVRQMEKNIQSDLDKNIIAVWHDESHLNRYVADKHPKILSPAFAYSEGAHLEFKPRILMLDKRKLGGHKHMRGKETIVHKLNPNKKMAPGTRLIINLSTGRQVIDYLLFRNNSYSAPRWKSDCGTHNCGLCVNLCALCGKPFRRVRFPK